MSYILTTGGDLFFSDDFDAPAQITNISNAADAILTVSGGTKYKEGDVLVLDVDNWQHATDQVYKVTAVDSNNYTLGELDSSNTDRFPTNGARGGTVMKVKSWLTVPQVLNVDPSGGDPKYITISPVFAPRDIKIPSGMNPVTYSFTLGYNPDMPVFKKLRKITQEQTRVAIKVIFAGGQSGYMLGHAALVALEMDSNDAVKRMLSISGLSDFVMYGSK